MTKTASANASSAPTTSFDKTIRAADAALATSTGGRCPVLTLEVNAADSPQAPPDYQSLDNFISELEQDGTSADALADARRWVADSFYADDGATVRAMRLRNGWSQSQLAEAVETSQSHIARIERGTENVTIKTCRKLCAALGIDMNALNEALQRQEALYEAQQQ